MWLCSSDGKQILMMSTAWPILSCMYIVLDAMNIDPIPAPRCHFSSAVVFTLVSLHRIDNLLRKQ